MAARSAQPLRRRAQLSRLALEDAVHDVRVGDEELLQRVWGEHEAPQRFGGDHVRRRGLAEQEVDLAEGLDDVLQLGRAHVREQRETRKDVDNVRAYFHVPLPKEAYLDSSY